MNSTQRRYFSTTDATPAEQGLQAVEGCSHQGLATLAPQSVIAELTGAIRNPHLCTFLDAVLHEPLIHGLVTLPLVRPGQSVQFPIQIIRRTANTYCLDYARTAQEKDLLLVAAVLWGMRSLLPLSIYGNTDLQDVFCTLIRSPLHQLDDCTCQVALLLRGLIGLGDEAGEDETLAHLQSALSQRIKGMHACKAWLMPSMKEAIERQTVRGVLHFAQRAAAQ